jgi:hypothetical protein
MAAPVRKISINPYINSASEAIAIVLQCWLYVLPQAMEQQLIDKYINKIIYSGCQLNQAPVMALFVTPKPSCKTGNTL